MITDSIKYNQIQLTKLNDNSFIKYVNYINVMTKNIKNYQKLFF